MNEDFIKEGFWSTTSDFKEEIYGRLIYSKLSGLLLELRGRFDVYKIKNVRHITLYGNVDQLTTKITLIGSDPIKWGNTYIDLRVNSCLIGAHVDVSDGLKIKTAHFEYFGLQDFLSKSGLNIKKNDGWDVSVNYKYQSAIEVKLDHVKIFIQNWFNQRYLSDYGKTGNKDILLKEFIQIKFDYDVSVDLKSIFNDSNLFTFLLTLLSNNVIFPLNLELTLNDGKKVKYYYQNSYFKNNYNNDDNCFVPLERADLSTLVEKFFLMNDQIMTFVNYKRTSDLYHNHFDENRFLDSLAILETYHRMFFDNSIDSELQDTINKLINSGLIPQKQLKYFENLNHREKPNYQKYMELYQTLGQQCQDQITSDIKKYCRLLTDSRNAYTHNDRNRSNLLRDDNMITATQNNESLIKYLLLSQLGIEKESLDKEFDEEFGEVVLV